MKISVMLAFICNPYLAVMQKNTYLKYWKDEVDEVLIHVNGKNATIRKFIVDLWKDDDKVKTVIDVDGEVRQGVGFNSLMPAVTGGILMTLDSDNFIYARGVVTKYANLIRNGQAIAIGSPGNHVKPSNIANKIVSKYHTVRLNPFMSFWDVNVLLHINNLTFHTHYMTKGEVTEWYGKAEEDISFDVMAPLSVAVFQKYGVKKVIQIKPRSTGEYVHVGALSSIFRRNFRGIENYNETQYEESVFRQPSNYYCWYYLIYEATKNQVTLPEINKAYEENFDNEIGKLKLNVEDIKGGTVNILRDFKGLF